MSDILFIESAQLSDQGQKRSNNEDFALFFEPKTADEMLQSGSLYIVADGVGGAQAGERASRYACEKVMFEYYHNPEIESPGERLERAIRQASGEIFTHAENKGIRMATTIVAAAIRRNKLTIANVGDSRAYLIRNGVPYQITKDHTEVEQMVEDGLLTREEARTAKGKNKLARSVGGEANALVDVVEYELHPGDKLLLCSDGLTRYATQTDLAQFTQRGTPEEIVKRLVDYANGMGGADNITSILVSVQETESLEMATSRNPRGETPHPVVLESIANQPVPPPTFLRTSPPPPPPSKASKTNPFVFHGIRWAVEFMIFIFIGAILSNALINSTSKNENKDAINIAKTAEVLLTATEESKKAALGSESPKGNVITATIEPTIEPSPAPTVSPTLRPEGNYICIAQSSSDGMIGVLEPFKIDYYKFPNDYVFKQCELNDQDQCLSFIDISRKLNEPDLKENTWIFIPDINEQDCNNGNGKWVQDISKK